MDCIYLGVFNVLLRSMLARMLVYLQLLHA